MRLLLRTRAVSRETSQATRLVAAMARNGSASTSTTNDASPAAPSGALPSQAASAGIATSSSKSRFMSISAAMRLPRMSRGRIGMDSSSSLSRASNSCALAVNTLPMNMSANAVSPKKAKYSHASPAS